MGTLYKYEYLPDYNLLLGVVSGDKIEKDDAVLIYDFAVSEVVNQPDFSKFILDVSNVNEVSDPAIGILMKYLEFMKNKKKIFEYMALIMNEKLLHDLMLRHPTMFDYYAIFDKKEDAIQFVNR